MIPIPVLLSFASRYRRAIAIGFGVLALAVVVWMLFDAYGDAREADVRAEFAERDRKAAAEAQAATLSLRDDFADIDVEAFAVMRETASLERKQHDKIIRVGVPFYRDRPDCSPPDGLWRGNDQYADELGAASGVRVDTLRPDPEAGQR